MRKPKMVEVHIDSIRVSLVSPQRVVLLKENEGERYLPIWIGPYEAEAIQYALHEVEVARPLTHDLLKNILQKLGARVLRVEVVDLRENVFYGNIVLEHGGRIIEIDARPSDALALAVRAHVPIYVAEHVLQSAGIVPEEGLSLKPEESTEFSSLDMEATPQAEASPRGEGAPETTSPEEEERLSVFEDFIEDLLEDLESSSSEEDQPDE